MPLHHVDLTDKLDTFVVQQVEIGNYADASDVIQQALSAFAYHEEAKLLALKAAIQEGFDSGVFEGDAIQSVREEFGLIEGK